jgi:hypothetical protein
LIYNEHSEGGLDAIGSSHWEFEEIDDNLPSLAASKLDFEDTNGLVTKEQFELFRRKITKDYVRWLTKLKKMAYESQVPLPLEVMDLVSQSAGDSSELSLPVNAQGFIDHPKQKPEDEDGDERQVLPEPRKPF